VGLVDGSKTKMLEILPWEEFKLCLNERFTPHHPMLKEGMELLELAQGDKTNSLAHYVQNFNTKLIIILFNEEFAKKLALLHGLKL
jgi:hypothetical protein